MPEQGLLRNRDWFIQPTSVPAANGLYEALEALAEQARHERVTISTGMGWGGGPSRATAFGLCNFRPGSWISVHMRKGDVHSRRGLQDEVEREVGFAGVTDACRVLIIFLRKGDVICVY